MNNKLNLDLIKRRADFLRAKQDSIRNVNLEQTLVDSGSTEVSINEDQLPYKDIMDIKIPGIQKGYPVDYLLKGFMAVGEAKRQQQMGEQVLYEKSGKYIKEKVAPLVGEMMTGDYARSSIANVAGLPVDAANVLLSLLGIEVSNKPFMGSKHVKESLDYLSGQPHSDKYINKP